MVGNDKAVKNKQTNANEKMKSIVLIVLFRSPYSIIQPDYSDSLGQENRESISPFSINRKLQKDNGSCWSATPWADVSPATNALLVLVSTMDQPFLLHHDWERDLGNLISTPLPCRSMWNFIFLTTRFAV